jgi:hypothetical protein
MDRRTIGSRSITTEKKKAGLAHHPLSTGCSLQSLTVILFFFCFFAGVLIDTDGSRTVLISCGSPTTTESLSSPEEGRWSSPRPEMKISVSLEFLFILS